jgi:phosphatidylserine/phosphatidylglycerophosphate/cardiolipin synthase-like enzyme
MLIQTGPPARDIARHFVQRWNFIKSSRAKERSEIPFLLPKGEYVAARDESKFKGTCRIQILRSSAEWSQGIIREVILT